MQASDPKHLVRCRFASGDGSFALRCTSSQATSARQLFKQIYLALEQQVEPRSRIVGRAEAKRLAASEHEVDAASRLSGVSVAAT